MRCFGLYPAKKQFDVPLRANIFCDPEASAGEPEFFNTTGRFQPIAI
jgi:hypothetical protein